MEPVRLQNKMAERLILYIEILVYYSSSINILIYFYGVAYVVI